MKIPRTHSQLQVDLANRKKAAHVPIHDARRLKEECEFPRQLNRLFPQPEKKFVRENRLLKVCMSFLFPNFQNFQKIASL